MTSKPAQIAQHVQKLVKTSPNIRTAKQALEAMFEVAFECLPQAKLWSNVYPQGYIKVSATPTQRLTREDRQTLAQMQRIWMEMVVEVPPFEDTLSELFDPYLGVDNGQFFTPNDISELCGELQAVTCKLQRKVVQDKPYSLYDMCAGGGSMIMGTLKTTYRDHGTNGIALTDIVAQDIDEIMCKLTAIQILFSSILHKVPISSLRIIWGNTLKQLNCEVILDAIPNCNRYYLTHPNEMQLQLLQAKHAA